MSIFNKNNDLKRASGWVRSVAVGLLGALLIPFAVNADSYPERDVEMLVGFSAGGPTDAAARIVAEEMGQHLGVNVVVVNRPGAGGEIAATELLRRDANGYSLFLATNGLLTVKPAVYKKTRFESDDFSLIGTVASYPHVVLVSNESQVESFSGLLDMMQSRPEGGSSASASNTNDLTIEWIKSLVPGLNIVRIPYKGASAVASDLITNRVDMAIVSPNVAAPLLDSGKVKALATTSEARKGRFSAYDTVAESYPGLEKFDVKAWSGLVVKNGTPQPAVDALVSALGKALESEEVQSRIESLGMDTFITSSSEFKAEIEAESALWEAVAKRAGLEFD